MAGVMILALSLAGLGLIVFGERIGLGLPLAAAAILVVLAGAGVAVAIASITSRLPRFLVGERTSAPALAATVACLVLFVLGADGTGEVAGPFRTGATLAGLLVGWLVMPFDPWRNFRPDTEADPARRADVDPAEGTRGALIVFTAAVTGAIVVLAVGHGAQALAQLGAFEGLREAGTRTTAAPDGSATRGAPLVAAALLPAVMLLGGMLGLVRAAAILVGVAVVAALVPALGILAGDLWQGLDGAGFGAILRGAIDTVASVAVSKLPAGSIASATPSFITGVVLAAVIRQPAATRRAGPSRFLVIILGAALALGFWVLAGRGEALINEVMALRIGAVPPAQWPPYVFDDALRGWLTACGAVPDDAQTAARACGNLSPRALLPAGSLRFSPSEAMPALAAALGLPTSLGFLWRLLPLVANLVALGVLLTAAATLFAERVLYRWLRPAALRSHRLIAARLTLAAGAGLTVLAQHSLPPPDPLLLRWALLSLGGIALVAMLGDWLIRVTRFFSRRATPAPSTRAPAPT